MRGSLTLVVGWLVVVLCVGCHGEPEGDASAEPRARSFEGVFSLLGGSPFVVLRAPEDAAPEQRMMKPRGAGEGDFGQRLCLLMRPETVVRYELPEVHPEAVLQYRVGVRSNGYQAPGTVVVRGRLDGDQVFEHRLACDEEVPEDERRWWPHSLPVPRGGALELEVQYEGKRPPGPFVGIADLRIALPFEHPLATSSPDAPNVLLVVIDTLRADRLHAYGNPRPVSPALDGLADAGMLFEEAYSSGPWTIPGTASILTGRSSPAHGLGDTVSNFLADRLSTLPELFLRAGCRTGAFSTNPLISEARNFDQGFETFRAYRWSPAAVLRDDVLAWLRETGERRFFLYVHLTDPHAPYLPGDAVRAELELGQDDDDALHARDLRDVLEAWYQGADELPLDVLVAGNRRRSDLYDGEILEADRTIGAWLAGLEAAGLSDRTLVCVTSDHGEEFLDHGLVGHYNQLHAESLHVPLLLRGPGVPRGQRVVEPLENRFLAPTLLRLAGVAAPDELAGPDLTRPDERAVVVAAGVPATANKGRRADLERRTAEELGPMACLRADGWLYLRHEGVAEGEEAGAFPAAGPFELLFDLKGDPGATTDLSAQEPERREAMGRALADWLASERARRPELVPPTAETRELLQSLGYIGRDD